MMAGNAYSPKSVIDESTGDREAVAMPARAQVPNAIAQLIVAVQSTPAPE